MFKTVLPSTMITRLRHSTATVHQGLTVTGGRSPSSPGRGTRLDIARIPVAAALIKSPRNNTLGIEADAWL